MNLKTNDRVVALTDYGLADYNNYLSLRAALSTALQQLEDVESDFFKKLDGFVEYVDDEM